MCLSLQRKNVKSIFKASIVGNQEKKERNKNKPEIYEIESRKLIDKINKIKSWFFVEKSQLINL